jgi:hypothetical protein
MLRSYREFQIDISSGSFVSPVAIYQGDVDFWTLSTSLDANTEYKWRCRDVSTWGLETEWSEAQYFTTLN